MQKKFYALERLTELKRIRVKVEGLDGSFCVYRRTNDVKQKKQKTEKVELQSKTKKKNVFPYTHKDPMGVGA